MGSYVCLDFQIHFFQMLEKIGSGLFFCKGRFRNLMQVAAKSHDALLMRFDMLMNGFHGMGSSHGLVRLFRGMCTFASTRG